MFGINPYDEPMFRVVWSESRYYIVGGKHTEYYHKGDGPSPQRTVNMFKGSDPNVSKSEAGYKWLPLYPGVQAWILEKWKDPIGFTGCSREQWDTLYTDPNTGLLTLGPYPNRGEYVHCFTFPVEPTVTSVYNMIGIIRKSSQYRFAEHKAAIEQAEEKKVKDRANTRNEVFLDSQQAFRNRASSVNPAKRRREDIKLKYTAEDVGLPTRGLSAGPRR